MFFLSIMHTDQYLLVLYAFDGIPVFSVSVLCSFGFHIFVEAEEHCMRRCDEQFQQLDV